jgi:hypothetical protein
MRIKRKCPKCQFENPEGIKFRGECSCKLDRLCPKCNQANPRQFNFCGGCGQNLVLSSDEKLKKIQNYLPKGILEKIFSQQNKIKGDKTQVTVMLCDMRGLTPLSEFNPAKII